MKRRSLLRSSPIFLVAGVIAFFFLVTLWNFAVEPFFPKMKLRSADASLAGITVLQGRVMRWTSHRSELAFARPLIMSETFIWIAK